MGGYLTSTKPFNFTDSDPGFFSRNFHHYRIGSIVQILLDQLPWWRFTVSEWFLFIYIFKVSRDSVVNGLDFYLMHLGLIPDVTI